MSQVSNWPAQLMRLARILKFWLKQVEVLYYPGSEQQRHWSGCVDSQADLRLFCSHITKTGFLMTWLTQTESDWKWASTCLASSKPYTAESMTKPTKWPVCDWSLCCSHEEGLGLLTATEGMPRLIWVFAGSYWWFCHALAVYYPAYIIIFFRHLV